MAAHGIVWVGHAPPSELALEVQWVPTVVACLAGPTPLAVVLDARGMGEALEVSGLSALDGCPVLLASEHVTCEVLATAGEEGHFAVLPLHAPWAEQLTLLRRAAAVRRVTPFAFWARGQLLTLAELSFATLEDADAVASSLASLTPRPQQVAGGLLELLVNAVEHGNLEIDRPTKRSLVERGQWLTEVQRRLSMPRFAGRRVRVRMERKDDRSLVFTITDEGPGFDHAAVLASPFDDGVSGKGVALARALSFAELTYVGRGNVVVGVVRG